MSKDKRTSSKKAVETVDNYNEFKDYELEDLLRNIHSIITFWKLDEIWPTNFIKDLLEICIDKSVSRSHINDK